MQRRTLVKTLFRWIALTNCRLSGQSVAFPGKHEATLKELAAAVLPESLGRAGTDAVADGFVEWVKKYRGGAEMQTGYGFTRVRYKPASPASHYLDQLDQLASGALTENTLVARRQKIAEQLLAADIRDLPFSPDGAHVVSDLMTFYFQSSEANDLAYGARIGRDLCRGLKSSAAVPAPLKQNGTSTRA